MSFGEQMRRRREELGLTRQALADRLGVSVSAGSHRALWRRVTWGAVDVLEAVMSVILLFERTKKSAVLGEDGACTAATGSGLMQAALLPSRRRRATTSDKRKR